MPRRSSRTLGVALGEALDVRLVDHRLVPGRARRRVVLPVEGRVDDDALRDRRRRRPRRRARGRRPRPGSGTYGRTFARSQRTGPSIAFAYGSIRSLCGLKRCPAAGVVGPVRRGSRSAGRARRRGGSSASCGPCVAAARRGVSRSSSSKRQSSTRSACSEKSEKFVPAPSQVAPSGNGAPARRPSAAPLLGHEPDGAERRQRQLGGERLVVPRHAPRPRRRRGCRRRCRRRRSESVFSASRQRQQTRQADAVARTAAPARG